LNCFDPKSWDAIVQTGLEKYLDCDNGPAPSLHHSWDVEATGTLSEGLAEQNMGPSQVGNSVALQREYPMSQMERVQDDDVSLEREGPILQRGLEERVEQNADVSLERENADVSLERGAVSGAVGTSRAVETSSVTPAADEHVQRREHSIRPRRPNPRFYGEEWVNISRHELDQCLLHSLDWTENTSFACFTSVHSANQANTCPITQEMVDWHPLTLVAKATSSDTPNWNQAMNGPYASGYWDAMVKEVETLTDKDAWSEIAREQWMKVVPSTWAFRVKRLPDGSLRKLKARFCVRGDQQTIGVDFFETYAPVVSWTTIRTLLILSTIYNLSSCQVDYTAAFVHAEVKEDIYIDMPRGFQKPGKVLKLKKSLYGLRQSPRNFFEHLKSKFAKLGFKQAASDPCLFISENVVCIVYVDDTLFFSSSQSHINQTLEHLRSEGLELNVEDDVAGFLGVHMKRQSDGSIEMTQTGLIERIIKALGLEQATTRETPAEHGALGSDKDGESGELMFNYKSVIGMLGYLDHTRPDIKFAVSQCARFSNDPKKSHEVAVKRIGRYLLGTKMKGLILKPSKLLKIDCYVDADFVGLWPYEDIQDPSCVKSRTGYMICVADCPVIWKSKLQTETALSTMEAEYVALSMAMRELIPLKYGVLEVASSIGLKLQDYTAMKNTIWEDNAGALALAKLEPPRMTPRSRHYAVKYHWFREHIVPEKIELVKIETKNQLADILTKGLRTDQFKHIRNLLMGW
jgi:Reverse transcriptase (RNA-dependent DNA polymerase)